MSPRWRKLLRDAWLHKARTLLVVFAVATGLVGAGSVLDTWALIKRTTAETYGASHPVSATLRMAGDGVDPALLARVRAMPAIGAVRARRVAFATAAANGTHTGAELFTVDDFDTRAIGRLEGLRGAWPPRDGGIAIEQSSMALSGADFGGPMTIAVGTNPARTLRVDGVAHDVGLPPGWMDHVVYGYLTPATMAQLGLPASFDELQFVVRDTGADREAVRRIAADVRTAIEASGRRVVAIDVPIPGRHPHAAQMDSLTMTQGAFGLLSLLVSCFLIVNLVGAMLTGQAREIGVMKTLGARPGQIGALYLGHALGVGLLACAIAVPVSIALARPYAGMQADMLNFPIAGRAIPWWAIALQVAVGCLLPVAAAWWPVRRACRASVASALSDPGIAASAGGFHVQRRIAVPGVGRPLLLAIGNAFRKRGRMLLTLLALAAGGAVYLGADDLRRGVRGSVDLLFANQHYDAALSLATPHRADAIERIALATNGVARVQAFARARATAHHADGLEGDAFGVLALPADSPMLTPHVVEGRWLSSTDRNALVVNRSLAADDPTLHPGATVTLAIDGKPTAWRVVGVVDAAVDKLAFAPLATIQALRGDDGVSTLVVATTARDHASVLDTTTRLRDALERAGMPVAGSQLVSEARTAIDDHLSMVVNFLGGMAWLMIAIGGMGLASTMGLSVLERMREIGVLRAIGARHGAILAMVQVEGLAVALLGWLVALPLSMPMATVLSDAFGKIMLPVPTQAVPAAGSVLSWLAMTVVVSLLACALPARRAMRLPTAAALSYD